VDGPAGKTGGELTEEEKAWFDYSARHYVDLKNDYLK
jgi:carbonic anhydrase/acetyltransferase-like protein (isoleucine patch superfamily)